MSFTTTNVVILVVIFSTFIVVKMKGNEKWAQTKLRPMKGFHPLSSKGKEKPHSIP
jgi:hypothetical protein